MYGSPFLHFGLEQFSIRYGLIYHPVYLRPQTLTYEVTRVESSRWSFSTCKSFLADMSVNLIGMCVPFVLVLISVSQCPSQAKFCIFQFSLWIRGWVSVLVLQKVFKGRGKAPQCAWFTETGSTGILVWIFLEKSLWVRKEEAWVKLNGFVIYCGHLERLNSKHLEITRGREVGFKAMDLIVQGVEKFVRRGVCFNIHFGNWDREKVVRVSRQRCQHWMRHVLLQRHILLIFLTLNFLTLSLPRSLCPVQLSHLFYIQKNQF